MRRQSLTSLAIAISAIAAAGSDAIRINQIGYLPDDIKAAVWMISDTVATTSQPSLTNISTGHRFTPDSVVECSPWQPMAATRRIYFSSINEPGTYVLTAGDTRSPQFKIGDDIYRGLNEIPLYYMRQQRCGYNPSLDQHCHQHDGYLVLADSLTGKHVNVRGGWHDASDYLQYLTTSANAVYQMLWAYRENPHVWADQFDADGRKGSNGIADILDEARWGLEWMRRMNPNDSLFLNQIADDRDHRFAGLPADDNVDYGWGPGRERPVYPCHGAPYGLRQYKNRSRGLASSVGKFASSFALGAAMFAELDPEFAADLDRRSANAYNVAKANPGECQTASTVSPYFYEEQNWADDMALAASTRYLLTLDDHYRADAISYGRLEPVTPWMGADSARHYQWYPFVNLAMANLARDKEPKVSAEFIRNMRSGLQRVADRGSDNAFRNGVPFIWCSNNLTVALATQAMLYRDITGDNRFIEIETAARDWLLGANPWGQCMIVGLPGVTSSPRDPHSALTNIAKIEVTGGLVDGPVYTNIFKSLWGVQLRNPDAFAPYQNSTVVYHDDYHDYSTNEPTMDGTASLTYMLGRLAR